MKMSELSENEIHEQQEIGLEHILEAHERNDLLVIEYYTAKLLAADARDMQIGDFSEKPLLNSDGFSFLL